MTELDPFYEDVQAHYDLSNDFFDLFLDPSRMYSCAYFKEDDYTLEQAQYARKYPHELSGGEAQRVALARALATEPEVVLMDEPFASLDASLRETLREEVVAILRQAGASALLVTHDQQEALSLADVVVVMRGGRVEQVGRGHRRAGGRPGNLTEHAPKRRA